MVRTPVKTADTPARTRKVLRSLKRGTKDSLRLPASKLQTTKDPRTEVSDDEWQDMVATAAYFRAEARGFEGGSADEDWYEAEAELREHLSAGDSSVERDSDSGGEASNIGTKGE
ncbi:MAG TPA: DUF2934 domain-containing protein [Burkholderiales bacterium]|nr:DUF2934 domain-containing protein [Burkholderiales bacterium]